MQTDPVSPASTLGRNRFVHTDRAAPFEGELIIASWNVQGLTDIKLWELTAMMQRRSISILCIQETRVKQSPPYTTDNNFLVILSGSGNVGRDYAGVGIIVAPWPKHAVL